MGRPNLTLSEHAVVRYQERWRPELSIPAARHELERLLATASLERGPNNLKDWRGATWLLDGRIRLVVRSGKTVGLRGGLVITTIVPPDRWSTTGPHQPRTIESMLARRSQS
jgi:hypothetical protein